MNKVVDINTNDYPIVSVCTLKCDFTEGDIDLYIDIMTQFYKDNVGKNVVVIYDISILKAIDAKGRIKIGEWLKENTQLIKSAVKGVCYVQKNFIHKITLQGIFLVKKPEWEHKAVKSLSEGIEWGRKILENL